MREKEKKILIIYDAIYHKITITEPVIKKLISTQEMERLKHIKQLGTLCQWIDSANHSRFSHSLGVYHLIEQLLKKHQFAHLPKREKLEVMVAGLLHDIGHGPYSHIFEKVASNFSHEKYSIALINNPQGKIYAILQEGQLNRKRIAQLILNQSKQDWAQSLISGQFDLDRLDFLIRDRYFLGLRSEINIERLMDNIVCQADKILFRQEAILDLENYLLARYYFHKNFFWHPENLFFENLFINIFQRLKDLKKTNHHFPFSLGLLREVIEGEKLSLTNFLNLNDHYLWTFFHKMQRESKDAILVNLIKKFLSPSKPLIYQINNQDEKNKQEQYYSYFNQLKLTIYNTKAEEILFLNEKEEIKTFSQISMIFNQTKKYQINCKISY